MRVSVKVVGGPGDDGLDRVCEIARGGGADGLHVPLAQGGEDLVQNSEHALAGLPLRARAQQVFFRHHFEDGTDILGHAAVDENEAFLKLAAGFRRGVVGIEDAVLRHEPSAADAVFRVAFGGEHAFDQLHARPDAAGILPAAAGASEPFAEQSARQRPAGVRCSSRVPVSEAAWPVARMQR